MALAWMVLSVALAPSFLPELPATEADLAFLEALDRLAVSPVDLNRATVEELLLVPWLDPFLAHRILAFRDSVGGFRNMLQLAEVPGMTDAVLEALLPVVTVAPRRQSWKAEFTARTRTDSFPCGVERAVLFSRAAGDLGPWSGAIVTEKDEGETRVDDYLGAGVELRARRAKVVFLDYGFGAGQGLVFSRPEWRSSYLDGRGSSSSGPVTIRSAAEVSRLRGAAVQVTAGGWRFGFLGSYAGRDAKLNDDGTVARLVGSGVHNDSGSRAVRDGVRELTGGAVAEFRRGVSAFSLATGLSSYDRVFAPAESSGSFFGRALAYGGAGATADLGDYRVGVELAGAASGGLAGVLDLRGLWDHVDLRAALRGRQRRFFAPHGRWTGISGRDDRLDAAARLGFHSAGFAAAVGGNTYRDFDLDSIPARVELTLKQDIGMLSVGLELERRLRADVERSRRGRFRVAVRPSQATEYELVVADAYPDSGGARGLAASASAETSVGPVDLAIVIARFDILGSGITMRVPEPGSGRSWSSHSASASAWRLAAGSALRIGRSARLGVKVGCEWVGSPVLDLGAQLDLEAR